MLTAILLFLASVLGALALALLMPRPGRNLRLLGTLREGQKRQAIREAVPELK